MESLSGVDMVMVVVVACPVGALLLRFGFVLLL